jgi:hypothetical protein
VKEAIKEWLMRMPPLPGLLACGVRFNDQTALCRSYSRDFPVVALEQAWRCVADTFRVLRVHRLPGSRLCWVYARARLFCVRREDGTILSLFVCVERADWDVSRLEGLIADFEALPTAPALIKQDIASRPPTA